MDDKTLYGSVSVGLYAVDLGLAHKLFIERDDHGKNANFVLTFKVPAQK